MMRSVFRLFLYGLLVFSHLAYSQVDPIQVTEYAVRYSEGTSGNLVYSPWRSNPWSVQEAAHAYCAINNAANSGNAWNGVFDTSNSTSIRCYTGSFGNYFYIILSSRAATKCPSGTEPDGSGKCSQLCPLGFDRNAAGQCVKDCTGKQGQATTNGSYGFTGAVSTWSVSGCRVKCGVRVLAAGGGTGHECFYTGASADPEDPSAEPIDRLSPDLEPPPEEPDDCLRRGKGYISGPNGVTCVSGPDAPPGQRPKIESDSKQESGTAGPGGKPDPNASDYKKTETKTVNNGDGTISESKTETMNGKPDGNGGYTCPDGFTKTNDGKCQRQSGSTQDEAGYCAKNPSAPQCKGTKEDHCKENPNRAGCVELGGPSEGDSGELGTETIGVGSISVVGVSSGGSCPAGITFPKGLGSYNWDPICDFASAMRPIIISFAWIGAFFIVFVLKGGD